MSRKNKMACAANLARARKAARTAKQRRKTYNELMAGGKGRQWPVSTPDQQNDYLLDAFASLMGGKAHKK